MCDFHWGTETFKVSLSVLCVPDLQDTKCKYKDYLKATHPVAQGESLFVTCVVADKFHP